MYSSCRVFSIVLLSAAMIGAIKRVCAMIIAVGVYSRPRMPSGPDFDNIRYTQRPTTTGGNPMRALMTTMITGRPQKDLIASRAPKGMPIRAAKNPAISYTCNDKATTPQSVVSAERIS